MAAGTCKDQQLNGRETMKKLMTLTLCVIILTFLSDPASAADIVVDPNGSYDHTTINAAITVAVNGQTIIVRPGTYVDNINMSDKAITLRSTDPTDPAIVASTIINGNSTGSVITCSSGEGANTVINGFVITNGSGTDNGSRDFLGGGMYNLNSSPTVLNCTFNDNTAKGSKGISGGDLGGYGNGGGMYNSNSAPTVNNCTFSSNQARGGLGKGETGGSGNGGGMYNTSASAPKVNNCTFISNGCLGGQSGSVGDGGDAKGGGMYNDNSSPQITDCTFTGNGGNGGYAGYNGGPGGGILNSSSSATVTNSYFCGNSPDEIYGSYTDGGDNSINEHCPEMFPFESRIPGDIDASGNVNLVDFAIIADQMTALSIIADNWLAGTE